jgi:hypothetical protein
MNQYARVALRWIGDAGASYSLCGQALLLLIAK